MPLICCSSGPSFTGSSHDPNSLATTSRGMTKEAREAVLESIRRQRKLTWHEIRGRERARGRAAREREAEEAEAAAAAESSVHSRATGTADGRPSSGSQQVPDGGTVSATTATKHITFNIPETLRQARASKGMSPSMLGSKGGSGLLRSVAEDQPESLPESVAAQQRLLSNRGDPSDHVSHNWRGSLQEGGLHKAMRVQSETEANRNAGGRQRRVTIEVDGPKGSARSQGWSGNGAPADSNGRGARGRRPKVSHQHHHTTVDLQLVAAAVQAGPNLRRCVWLLCARAQPSLSGARALLGCWSLQGSVRMLTTLTRCCYTDSGVHEYIVDDRVVSHTAFAHCMICLLLLFSSGHGPCPSRDVSPVCSRTTWGLQRPGLT